MKTRILTVEKLQDFKDHFKESDFWKKISKTSKSLGKIPTYYALILYYLLNSPNVSIRNKAIIMGALGYLILPTDLIADIVPVFGFVDDAAALKLAYEAIKVSITPDIENQANSKLSDWFDSPITPESINGTADDIPNEQLNESINESVGEASNIAMVGPTNETGNETVVGTTNETAEDNPDPVSNPDAHDDVCENSGDFSEIKSC